MANASRVLAASSADPYAGHQFISARHSGDQRTRSFIEKTLRECKTLRNAQHGRIPYLPTAIRHYWAL